MSTATLTIGEAPTAPTSTSPRRRHLDVAVLGLLLMMLPTTAAMLLDTRTFLGIDVWIKPLKFQASLALHLSTVALFLRYAQPRFRDGAVGVALAWLLIVPAGFEAGYITLQAGRGAASHFNETSPLYVTLYALMGVGAVTLVGVSAVVGVLVLRARDPRLTPALQLAVGLGLVLGSVLGGLTGAYMSAQGGHWVGGVRSDAGGLPVVGWSTTGGDLRVPHFFGMHLMQVLPVVGWLAGARRWARAAVVVTAVLGIAITLATSVQAVQGRSFLVW